MMSTQDHRALPPPPPQQQPGSQQPFPPLQPPQFQQNFDQQLQQQAYSYPNQQQHQQGRAPQSEKPRPKSRSFSFRSDKSQKSADGKGHHHVPLIETHAEKESRRLHSKADPTLAMNEAEPSAVAALDKSNLASLRASIYRDPFGNPISDPDRSNPTRSRWERPLDTIRSFEAAIDGGYKRQSMIRADSEQANWNRRSSFYGNNPGQGFPRDSYYAGRPNSFMPSQSVSDLRQRTPGPGQGHDGYFDQQPQGINGYGGGPMNGRQRYSRMALEPQFNAGSRPNPHVYPFPNNHRSYETVGSGSGTSGEPAGYQTDPTSSDNSSVERVQSPPKKPEPVNDYGIGFTTSPTYKPSEFSVGVNGNQIAPRGGNGLSQQQYAPPAVPQKDKVLVRKPSKQADMGQVQQRPDMGDKRKSWFTRRFSKNS